MKLKILFAVTALILALPALGHDAAKGPNGGRVVQAGDYHVELVARSNVIEVFLTDTGDKPVPPAGFKGVAILLVAGKSARIVLEPAGDTRLSGKAANDLPAQPKGVVQITSPNGKTAQAKFN
jgi:hypothetical protein